jgi:2-polyprenyl-3-methyl-5-hydroxy-6-metoxy-1,4-benzoquinol methylase
MGDSNDQQTKWNARYASIGSDMLPQPSEVLRENQHLLPNILSKRGVALDLACGLGGNALWLAQKGFETHAWDVSCVAINKLNGLATTLGVSMHASVRDVVSQPPAPQSYDVIVVSRFLHRPLIPKIIAALKPAGLVFYQTFIQEKPADVGPTNPDYLLAQNELLSLFSGLRILVYREEGQVGNVVHGFRHEAMLVGQKS